MPPAFLRRRAARFAELVDQPAPLRRHSPVDHGLADLADTTDHLRRAGVAPTPDPAFRTDLRAVLIAAAGREQTSANTTHAVTPARWLRWAHPRARWAVAVGLAAGVVGVAGLSTASAVPGDNLYSLKRSAEQAQLAVTASDVDKGRLYLGFARKRMREADAVTGNPAEINVILADMDAETRSGVKLLTTAAVTGHELSPLDTVAAFVVAQTRDMPEMMSDIAGAAHGRAIDSNSLIEDVQIRADWLRADLTCTSILTAKVDDLGPRPQSCSPRSVRQPLPPSPAATDSADPAPARPAAAPVPTPSQGAARPAPVPAPPVTSAPPPPAPVPTPTLDVTPVPVETQPALIPPDGVPAVDPAPPTIGPVDVPSDVPVDVPSDGPADVGVPPLLDGGN